MFRSIDLIIQPINHTRGTQKISRERFFFKNKENHHRSYFKIQQSIGQRRSWLAGINRTERERKRAVTFRILVSRPELGSKSDALLDVRGWLHFDASGHLWKRCFRARAPIPPGELLDYTRSTAFSNSVLGVELLCFFLWSKSVSWIF